MIELNKYPYCNCWIRGQFFRQDGYTLDGPSGLWVHSRCHKPSKMNYDRSLAGLPHIPQPKKEFDIYEYERTYEWLQEARRIVEDELDWESDPELDYDYS